jgi:hypothetical protein
MGSKPSAATLNTILQRHDLHVLKLPEGRECTNEKGKDYMWEKPTGLRGHPNRERYVNRILREAFGQAKCIRSLNSLSASWRVADPERSAI